jgi:hypothetical protein
LKPKLSRAMVKKKPLNFVVDNENFHGRNGRKSGNCLICSCGNSLHRDGNIGKIFFGDIMESDNLNFADKYEAMKIFRADMFYWFAVIYRVPLHLVVFDFSKRWKLFYGHMWE